MNRPPQYLQDLEPFDLGDLIERALHALARSENSSAVSELVRVASSAGAAIGSWASASGPIQDRSTPERPLPSGPAGPMLRPADAAVAPFAMEFFGLREPQPGPRWKALYGATWPGYRSWYLSDGEAARPTLSTARRELVRHFPELVPTYEQLVELAGGDELSARMLTLWDPPAFLPACSQAVLVGDTPMLVRNYDYRPDLCERVVYSSAFTGRRVIGSGDCLWGLLDGMNDAGLVVSLAFGGRPGSGRGFGVPLVIRYLLETAETVADVTSTLARVPVHMAYNLTVLDGNGDVATIFVAPDAEPEVSRHAVATNHRGLVPERSDHAVRFASVERQQVLLDLLDRQPNPDTLVSAFLRPPLYRLAYHEGFGTIYTAAYRPLSGVVDYVWPGSTWRRGFDSTSAKHTAVLGAVRR